MKAFEPVTLVAQCTACYALRTREEPFCPNCGRTARITLLPLGPAATDLPVMTSITFAFDMERSAKA